MLKLLEPLSELRQAIPAHILSEFESENNTIMLDHIDSCHYNLLMNYLSFSQRKLQPNVVSFLIQNGCDIDQRSKAKKKNALTLACENKLFTASILQVLLEAGADIHDTNEFGSDALMLYLFYIDEETQDPLKTI
jgi:ankyrin repeat protein